MKNRKKELNQHLSVIIQSCKKYLFAISTPFGSLFSRRIIFVNSVKEFNLAPLLNLRGTFLHLSPKWLASGKQSAHRATGASSSKNPGWFPAYIGIIPVIGTEISRGAISVSAAAVTTIATAVAVVLW